MYNSKVIALIADFWTFLEEMYKTSFLKKILSRISSFFKRLSSGSLIIRAIKVNNGILENSIINKVYRKLVELYNRLIGKTRRNLENIKDSSLYVDIKKYLVGDMDRFLDTSLIFILSFSIFRLVLNLYFKSLKIGWIEIISLIMGIVSFILLKSKVKIVSILSNSKLITGFINFISIEEEGSEQWW